MSSPRFSADEERVLRSVLDEIVPPSADGRMPGAGEVGLVGPIEQALAAAPELGPVVAAGLSAVDAIARRRNPGGFAALAGRERLEVLDELATQDQAFLPTLTFLTYANYYQDARVLRALGFEPRPPHPRGYEMKPNDLTLLDAVRRRPKMYREC